MVDKLIPDESSEFPQLDERQKKILEFLKSKSNELCKIYLGIYYSLKNPNNPDAIAQAAHSARELIAELPKRITSIPVHKNKFDAIEFVKKLAKVVDENPCSNDISNYIKNNLPHSIEISKSKRESLLRLIKTSDAVNTYSKNQYNIAASEIIKLNKEFCAIAHHGKKITNLGFGKLVIMLEEFILSLSPKYYDIIEEIDILIKIKNPDKSDLRKLQRFYTKTKRIEYFYNKLENTKWLSLLNNAKVFKQPIPVIFHDDGFISFPSWPHAVYLRKCAKIKPDEVMNILLRTEDTSNSRVYQNIIEVVLEMPANVAKLIVNKAKNWIRNNENDITLLPEKLSELVVLLADGGEVDNAFDLADGITALKRDNTSSRIKDIHAYVNHWIYKSTLVKIIPSLTNYNVTETIKLLCEKLIQAIKIENRNENINEDFSYIWRDTIEKHDENLDDIKDHLIDAICYVLNKEAEKENEDIESALKIVDKYKLPILKRIELHILSKFSSICLDRTEECLSTESYFDNKSIHHEFYWLLNSRFNKVSRETQEKYISWVEGFPDLSDYKKRFIEYEDRKPTKDEIKRYKDHWLLRKFTPIATHLSGSKKTLFEELESKHGKIEYPDFETPPPTTWVGPTSPITLHDLSKKSILEVVDYLKEWKPILSHQKPSPEGLGRCLTEDAESRAVEYSNMALEFKSNKIRPVYIETILFGLENSLKKNTQLNWNNIIELCEWVLFTDELIEPEKKIDEFETGCKSARKRIASIIGKCLERPYNRISYNLQNRIFRIIELLTQDEEPDLEHEEKYFSNPIDTSINTVRGEAAHTIFKYAMWCDFNINKSLLKTEQTHNIPIEVLTILHRFLNPELEQTKTIRAVIGFYLQDLVYLDINWLKDNIEIILPQVKELKQLCNAALFGYFAFSKPHHYMFENLPQFYKLALNWLMQIEEDKEIDNSRQNFISHIIHFYWYNVESVENSLSMLKEMLLDGTTEIKKHVIDYISRNTKYLNHDDFDGDEIYNRLKRLYEWYIELAEKNPNDEQSYSELKSFGWWFTYCQFKDIWLLQTLNRTLKITNGEIEWGHKVIVHLRDIVNLKPELCAVIVDQMVKSNATSSSYSFWESELFEFYKELKSKNDKDSWDIAIKTINHLGECGYLSFRNLLD